MRLFVGIPLSADLKEKIKPLYSVLKETGADFNFVSLENLHFTLKFLGEVEESKVGEIERKLKEISARKFAVSLKKVGVFPSWERINVIWIGTESKELLSLMKKVDDKLNYLRKNDFDKEVAHLTLARVKSGRNKEKLQEVLKKVENDEFGRMMADKFVLYKSELKLEGPVYRAVGEFWLE